MRLIISITPGWSPRGFVHFLNRRVSGVFGVRSISFEGGAGRESSMLSHHDTFHVTCGILFRRASALRPFATRTFGVLFSVTFGALFNTMPRFGTSALCIFSSPTFGNDTHGSDQWDTGHLNLVAFLHERRLRQPTSGVVRPKTHRDPCL
jgi:hypothetical protein